MNMVDMCNEGYEYGDDEYISLATHDMWCHLSTLENSMLRLVIDELRVNQDQYLIEDNYELLMAGVWDLSMIGNEYIEVKRKFHKLIGGSAVSDAQDGRWAGGVCLNEPDGRVLKLQLASENVEYQNASVFQLKKLKHQINNFGVHDYEEEGLYKDVEYRLEIWRKYFAIDESLHKKYYPMKFLPEDSLLVVRKDVLKAFEETFSTVVLKTNTAPHYQSKNLQLLMDASTRFWKNSEENDRDSEPPNEIVEKWLLEKGLSKRLAEAGATIIRPNWAGTGRKPG